MEPLYLKSEMPKLDDTVFVSLDVDIQPILRDRVLLGMLAISSLREGENYPFDETSVQQAEDYLLTLKGRVLRWGEGLRPERIITRTGLKTTSKKHIDEFCNYLDMLGCFYAYCVAKLTGGKFVQIDGALGVEPPEEDALTCFPVGKVFKFLRNGDEDSLVGFLAIVRARAVTQPLLNGLLEVFKGHIEEYAIELPEGSRLQYWHNSLTGDLTKLAYVDAGGKEIVAMCVNDGIDLSALATASDEVMRDFAASRAGQAILRGAYSKPDENGMCKRADSVSEDLQLECLRGYLQCAAGNRASEGEQLH